MFAVADVDAVRELIARWEDESTGYTNPPLNCEVWCIFITIIIILLIVKCIYVL